MEMMKPRLKGDERRQLAKLATPSRQDVQGKSRSARDAASKESLASIQLQDVLQQQEAVPLDRQ
jgi:hypothetical protein